MQAVLVPVEHHQRCGCHARNLPAQLSTDRAAGPCHENTPSGDQSIERSLIESHWRTREQILEAQRANLLKLDPAGDDVAELGQRLDRNLVGLEGAYDRPEKTGTGARNRDQHLIGSLRAEDSLKVLSRPEHWHVVDAMADLRRVVVDEPDRLILVAPLGFDVSNQHLTGIAGADDQEPFSE